MNRLPLCKLSVTLVLLLLCSSVYAQSNTIWTKRVTRTINIQIPRDTLKRHIKDKSTDTTLIELIIKGLYAGQMKAYQGSDYTLSSVHSLQDLTDMFEGKSDTIFIIDPKTGKELKKVTRRDFNPEAITQFRIMEDWEFNPMIGWTVVQMVAIAPLVDVYNQDGSLRAHKALFWLKYADVASIISRYNTIRIRQNLPQYALQRLIWNDYFLHEGKPNNPPPDAKVYTQRATRLLNIQLPEDTVTHHLQDASTDTTLLEMLMRSMLKGGISTYTGNDVTLTSKLTDQAVQAMVQGPLDTIEVEDPVTAQRIMKTYRRNINYESVERYRLIEDWAMNSSIGRTEIQIAAMAPMLENDAQTGRQQAFSPMFWLKFQDLQGVLNEYQQSRNKMGRPENTIGRLIWDDYFINETKPKVMQTK
ncbi:MAG: hypothetical protein WCG87_07120 [Bacteroidota bacterium]